MTTTKILMADDAERYHSLYRATIHDALEAQVDFATDGHQCLAVLEDHWPYDLVILDYNMPGLNGGEVLQAIREQERYAELPVVILTGETDPALQEELLNLGANDFIEKGSAPEVLVARIRSQLRQRQAMEKLTDLAMDREIFATGVLHDIRNTITTVIGMSDLIKINLEKGPVDPEAIANDVDVIRDRAENLNRYATEIIGMVRDSNVQPVVEDIELTELLNWVRESVSQEGKGISWSFQETATTSPIIKGDSRLLKLAILNIFQNSIKYCPEDRDAHITVHIQDGSEGAADDHFIEVHFRDNGTGVEESTFNKLFAPFTKGTSNRSGFGLGLSMVRKAILTQGGTVRAENYRETDEPGLAIVFSLPKGESQ